MLLNFGGNLNGANNSTALFYNRTSSSHYNIKAEKEGGIMTFIDDSIVINVTENVVTITFVILSTYPVIYIIRSMIQFVSKAFNSLNPDKLFNIKKPTLGGDYKN